MTAKAIQSEVRDRGERFSRRVTTKIWREVPAAENPYIAESGLCHGYDLFELMSRRSFPDVLYLLFRGELPDEGHARLLESLLIGLINPGPRHAAVRAAMTVSVSKTDPAHFLPIGLSVLSGDHLGAGEAMAAMRFLRRQVRQPAGNIAARWSENHTRPAERDWRVAPGFGSRFGSADRFAGKLAEQLLTLPGAGRYLRWGQGLAEALVAHGGGWLTPGIAAAALLDLGFTIRSGAGMFQLLSAPGILAHAVELSNKPLTAVPFIDNDHYVIERDAT